MAANKSSAVMAQRSEPHDSLDYFPTPPWGTRALCEWIKERSPLHLMKAWEPAAGPGHMVRPLSEYFSEVSASDIFDYGQGFDVEDFLWPTDRRSDWIITNPPFRLAEQFALTALQRANSGVALLVRTSFLESVGRYSRLYAETPPTDILQFTERLPMHKGRLVEDGSTATAYCWLVWRIPSARETRFHWIAPCRSRFERSADYSREQSS
jgi:hypothetical protein